MSPLRHSGRTTCGFEWDARGITSPGVASFRFHAGLDSLLAPERRGRAIPYPVTVSPSIKDAIEALGVPHTEVGHVVVNGRPVDFAYRLGAGDRIDVFPAGGGVEAPGIAPLWQPRLPAEIRLVADGHLMALARFLRLLGFDTLCDAESSDPELAARSAGEQRILLTRDRGLLKRSAVTHGVLVRHDDPDEQLLEVVRRLHLSNRMRPFTRCMACNGTLEDVAKAEVAGRLEPGTREAFDRFRRCRQCARIYWDGSHGARLKALVERARAAAT